MKFNLTETEKAYIGGFFDGEGHISIVKKKPNPPRWKNPSYKLVAVITNSNKTIIDFIHSKFKNSSHKHGPYKSSGFKPKGKLLYQLHFTGVHCKEFLREIHPYLRIKRDQANLALDYPLLEFRTHRYKGLTQEQVAEREDFYQRMKSLNKKGVRAKFSIEL